MQVEGAGDDNTGDNRNGRRVCTLDHLDPASNQPTDDRHIAGDGSNQPSDDDCASGSAGSGGSDGGQRNASARDHVRHTLAAGGAAVVEGLALLWWGVSELLLFVVSLLPFIGPMFADFLRVIGWGIRDTWRMVRNGEKERLYGLYVVVGLYGRGKSAFVVNELETIRKERGAKVKIYTNFGWLGEDGEIWGWRQMVEAMTSDTPHVFAWDELGSSLDQHNFGKEFPKDLFRLVTQMRKGPGIRIYATVQRFNNASVDLRRLAKYIIEVSGLVRSRWIWAWAYDGYEAYNDGLPRLSPMGQKDLRVVAWTKRFVFTDDLRSRYDSFRIIPALLEMSDEEAARRAGTDDAEARTVFEAHQGRRAGGAVPLGQPAARQRRGS